MKRCPITYELCGKSLYSEKGLKLLSQNLNNLELLSYTAEEQRAEAMARSTKISVQGVQPKLSAVLNIKESKFDLVDTGGKYILKPQHHIYTQLPENEDVTMRMAKAAGIKVPLHGMIWSKDKSLTYFIKRFDREGHKDKVPVEDFAQLARLTRDTKYNYTMEKIVLLLDEYCTFPLIEKAKLFKLVLFSFLVGNEDMHLKNYSVIRDGDKIELSPAYDLLNSTIVLKGGAEEIALSLAGKKRKLTRKVLVDYFGKERCGLTDKVVESNLYALAQAKDTWFSFLKDCFLSDDMKEKYYALLEKRMKIIGL
ncbi:MAG: type II toxin-antitoxin system HipA family toxin [Bacteroidetes bacterium HGW-Bacteroidetes-21]|jgi:serine/threonine-protein kinase HipA|nr:MAG: type II toxin-antitoxin system HipA family toxin [Bacteroidetes bacterium HGW-Bacteroidetes-21]